MTREEIDAIQTVIIEKAKELATLFDRPDGTTEPAMFSINVTQSTISVYGFDFGVKGNVEQKFHSIYFRGTGKMEICD